MFFCPAVPFVVPTTMIDAIKYLGLQSGLKLCLDAGDADSYTSGQVWLDRSGGGYDFNRGSGSGSDGADPTFNGVAGRQSSGEYWSFDGGDYFTYDSANETWMQNLHKNNSVWAVAVWAYISSLPVNFASYFADANGVSDEVGVDFFVRFSGNLRLSVQDGTNPSATLGISTTATVNTNAWNFLAVQVDEASGTGFLQINDTQEDKTTTYSGPTTGSATRTMQIGRDDDLGLLPSGYRLANLSAWESSAPTEAQMLALYNATRAKFGL